MTDLSSHGIVALVRNNDGKFLLLEEARELMRGHWAPPHGRCKISDDSEADAVVREVKEETNLIVTPVRTILTQAADTKVKTVSFWLVGCDDDRVILNDEASAYGWFTVEEALAMPLYPGTQKFFEQVIDNVIKLES